MKVRSEQASTVSPPTDNSLICFDPVADASARVLILGSMPGDVSLQMGQYYANPRNGFWKLMGMLRGFDPQAPYATRVHALVASGIALWDVLESCEREGSLDTAIKSESVRPNNFNEFFREHPCLRLVAFNGAKAERLYTKYVLPQIDNYTAAYVRLPSTSSANAALSFAGKVTAWRSGLGISLG